MKVSTGVTFSEQELVDLITTIEKAELDAVLREEYTFKRRLAALKDELQVHEKEILEK